MSDFLTEDMRKGLGYGIGGSVAALVFGLVVWVLVVVGKTETRTQEIKGTIQESARQELRVAAAEIAENIKEARNEAFQAVSTLRGEMYSSSREKEEAVTRQLDKIIARIEDLTKQVNKLQENLAVLLDKRRT